MAVMTRVFTRGLFKVVQQPPLGAYKSAMASLGSQAMILTSAYKNPAIDASMLHGMTLSSVTSLSVTPEPILQFNLQVPSATSNELHKSGYLALHILKPDADSVALARTFSRGTRYINSNESSGGKKTTPFAGLRKDQWSYYDDLKLEDDPLRGELEENRIHLPILTEAAERVLVCEKHKVFKVFNHEIWTCRVRDILVHVGDDHRSGGLLYFNRHFHKVGEQVGEE